MKTSEKQQAIKLRHQGHSLVEISQLLNVAKSTASVWTKGLQLNAAAQLKLRDKVRAGVIKSSQNQHAKTNAERNFYLKQGEGLLKELASSPKQSKLSLALLYWCEGGKSSDNMLKFSNSDPALIKYYLRLLQDGFKISPKKLKALIHLHAYHSEPEQIKFWSKVTSIPKTQFYNSYKKPNSAKRIKSGYQGCITINYYDKLVSREVFGIIKALQQFNS